MKLSYTDTHIWISEYTPKEKHIAINLLTGNELKKGIRLPKTLWVLREVFKYFPTLQQDPTLIKEGQTLKLQLENTINPSIKVIEGDRLRPYQRADVERLKKMDAAGIFNEPRTGKTPTVITLLADLQTERNLIVCPASLIWNWAREFTLWYNNCEIFVYHGSAKKQQETIQNFLNYKGKRVLIISKDTWRTKGDNFKTYMFDFVAVDEAHYLRNYKTATSKAIYLIRSKRRYAMTGTPAVKHSSDVYGILKFIDPKKYPSFWAFVDRYYEQTMDWMGHKVLEDVRPDRKRELEELIALVSVQRKRKDVMQWLPEKQRSTFEVRMESKQLKLYEDMRKFFSSVDANVEADAQNPITQLMRLRQICLDPRLLGFDTPGAKTLALLEFLENRREPIVIMSMFTSYLKLLKPLIEKLGLKVGIIHGEMSSKAKTDCTTLYQNGQYDVLLCNIITAGTGHTLDKGETVIFTDKAWNPIENDQAEDRICPTTEDKNHKHEIITFTCHGTIDAKIDEFLTRKTNLSDVVNNGGARALLRLLGE